MHNVAKTVQEVAANNPCVHLNSNVSGCDSMGVVCKVSRYDFPSCNIDPTMHGVGAYSTEGVGREQQDTAGRRMCVKV